MTVQGVNNNSHTGLYTLGAAAVGGGAGVATAYFTKPYLKGAKYDELLLKLNDNISKALEHSSYKGAFKTLGADEYKNRVANAGSIDELKKIFSNRVSELMHFTEKADGIDGKSFINRLLPANKQGKGSILGQTSMMPEEIFNQHFSGKSLDEIKRTLKIGADSNKMHLNECILKDCTGSNNGYLNKFSKIETVKSAVKEIIKPAQGKYAAIYGGIGAAVLGLATLIGCAVKNHHNKADGVDAQV